MMAILSGRLRAAAIAASTGLVFACSLSYAQSAGRFDLTGPRIDIRVTRDGKTLPIAAVPNLKAGDKLWLFADLPRTQSVHYLLVAAFLRGTTNPPPDTWFTKIETWNKKVREEGATLTVPAEAQQAILFLAPETGGDFATLRSAVQGRPGVFVRATQDLAEAGFEQARIEKYLDSIKQAPPGDPKALLDHSNLLARTLNLKPNQDCFNRPVDQQYTCLTQTGTQTLLDDGHGQTVVSMLSGNDASAFLGAAASTSMAGGGLYSAYVGAVVDLVRLMGNLHTAQYQYIPAISFPQAEQLNLRLNTAPSFHNPKSVIVIGLPAIQNAVPPPLRAADPRHVTCLLRPNVVLPVEGAPLVFSTGFAHDLVLHINDSEARQDIPLTPDAFKGGLVLASTHERKALPLPADDASAKPEAEKTKSPTPPSSPDSPRTPLTGTITGFWGFDPYTGPTLPLQDVPGTGWKLSTESVLIAGRDNHLTLSSTGTACIESITFEPSSGRQTEVAWKRSDKPNVVDVTLSLKSVDPGNIHLDVHQYGGAATAAVTAQTFSEPAQLNALVLHAGDTSATLTGTSLDQVRQLTLNDLTFSPVGTPSSVSGATSSGATQTLSLALPNGTDAPKLHPGDHIVAHVSLRDGRTLSLPLEIAPERPSVTLISRNVSQSSSPIHLANADALPIGQKLTFSLHSAVPFQRNSQVEIASTDDSLRTNLTVASGSLVLQNSHTVLGTFDPLKAFGTSAFGPLRLRVVASDGTPGDWIPLATLVRLPELQELHCPPDVTALCTLTGSDLYLVDSLATDAAFTNPIDVPEGFVGTAITLPRPPKTGFYLKLRDEPTSANTVTLPIQIQRTPAPAPTVTSAPPTTSPQTPPPPQAPVPEPSASSPPSSTPQTTPPQQDQLTH
ncbi:hypothetical protein [Edaphobacter aggregans]|uniref:hypothetical protein n=1 Tax=Edaphobacter aggregans TaxID=570835 RepID=UPI0009FDE7D7|nr:hypothetical protein [Edaphobacter aggregans]